MTTAIKTPRRILPGVVTKSKWLPPKLCLYGDAGIGKSTFGAGAPNPIFISTEPGVENLDVARFPVAESLDEFIRQLKMVADEEHDHGAVVIDTLNGLMHLYQQAFRGRDGYDFVNFGGHSGWGGVANEIHANLFPILNRCKQRGMYVIILAHAGTYTDKTSIDDVVKTGAAVNKNVWKVVMGEMDVVGKVEYIYVARETVGTKIKAYTREETVNGVRVKRRRIVFEGGMEVDAKTRIGYELPSEMSLSWEAFASHLGNMNTLAQEVRDLWQYLPAEKIDSTFKWLGVSSLEQLAEANRSTLSQCRNRLIELKSAAVPPPEEAVQEDEPEAATVAASA